MASIPDSDLSSDSMSDLNTPPPSIHLNRRIRFAPLPIPDIEKQLPINLHDPSSDNERPPSPPHQLCPSSKPTTQQMLAHHSISPALQWSKPRSLSLLPFPFKKLSSSSTNSLTPTPSHDTPTVSRVTSIDNSSSKNWAFGLSRWSSPSNGSPLARSQSVPLKSPTQLPKSSTSTSLPGKPRSDSTSSNSSATSTKLNPRKGFRMLNGRVYGGPKHRHTNANPFANARDEDVEFVEWGYGGMGSVRGAQSAGVVGRADDRDRTKWERLQHSGRNVVTGPGLDVDDEDDGSGMGWVKKRKAARERREKEERERVEAQSIPQVDSDLTPIASPTRVPSSSSVTPRPSTPAADDAHPSDHITAVNLPFHWHHRRAQSRTASMDTVPSLATVVPEDKPASTESDSESESEDDGARQAEDEYDDDDEDEDDDDDDDDEGAEARRKTALGAGVEKISRHN